MNNIISKIKSNYNFNEINDIFYEENDKIYYSKLAINSLNESDKLLFLLYSELGSYRKLGKLLNISHTICFKEIKRIKKIILNKINQYQKKDNKELK